jgi:hypothetical protein
MVTYQTNSKSLRLSWETPIEPDPGNAGEGKAFDCFLITEGLGSLEKADRACPLPLLGPQISLSVMVSRKFVCVRHVYVLIPFLCLFRVSQPWLPPPTAYLLILIADRCFFVTEFTVRCSRKSMQCNSPCLHHRWKWSGVVKSCKA